MLYSFRFYCYSSGFDIFIKYGYYDIRELDINVSLEMIEEIEPRVGS
jgi:hypothetical protein